MSEALQALKIISKRKKISIPDEMVKLGFEKCNGEYHLSIFLCPMTKNLSEENKSFVMRNYDDFVKVYEWAKQIDILIGNIKEDSLAKFLSDAVESKYENVKFIALKSLCLSKDRDLKDDDAISVAINHIENAGFARFDNNFKRRMRWPKFANGLDKVWLEEYVANEFNRDAAFDYIKKIGFHDKRYKQNGDQEYNIWYPRHNKFSTVDKILKNHLRFGGIINMKFKKKFEAFIPIDMEDGKKTAKMIVEKDKDGKPKKYFIEGSASNNRVDREDERMTSSFIQKMVDNAKGLTLFEEHKHDIDHTLGHISEAWGENESELKIKAELEPPDINPRVNMLVGKIKSGTPIGFSIYGTVLEAHRVWDKKLNKEIYEISDGILEEISVTAWPAAYDTLASAVVKSLKKAREEKDANRNYFEKVFSHSSKFEDNEPNWTNIEKSSLPKISFADNKNVSKNLWKYPHHFVKNGTKSENGTFVSGELFLSKSGLDEALNSALADKAPKEVISHLQNHKAALELNKAGKALTDISEEFDSISIGKEIISIHGDKILNLIKEYKVALKNSAEDKSEGYDKKIIVADEITKNFAERTAALIEDIIKDSFLEKGKKEGE